MNTRELIEQWPLFDQGTRTALLQAVSTRGKYRGYLLSSAPPQDKGEKWAAWSALVSNLAPARVSIFGAMFAPSRKRFSELERTTDSRLFRACLNATEPAGRWNLWYFHNSRETAQRNLPKVLQALRDRTHQEAS